MSEFEGLVALILAAVLVAAVARRVGAPYPVFLALGGALLAFLPGAPLVHASARTCAGALRRAGAARCRLRRLAADLRDNWPPVTGLVVFAVGLTTVAVAVVRAR